MLKDMDMPRVWNAVRFVPVLVLVLGCLASLAPALTVQAQEVPELKITSTAYIVIDADTGEIYAQRNAHERRAPASLTKIFTAAVAVEEGFPSTAGSPPDSVMVSPTADQVGFCLGEGYHVERW